MGWTLTDAIRDVEELAAQGGHTPEIDRVLADARALQRGRAPSPRSP